MRDPVKPGDEAARFRKLALDARQRAEKMSRKDLKSQMLSIAESYELLAELIEQPGSKNSK